MAASESLGKRSPSTPRMRRMTQAKERAMARAINQGVTAEKQNLDCISAPPSHQRSKDCFFHCKKCLHSKLNWSGHSATSRKPVVKARAGPLALRGMTKSFLIFSSAPKLPCCDAAGKPQGAPPPVRSGKRRPRKGGEAKSCARCAEPPWPNGQGVGPLIRRLRARVPQGVPTC